MRKNFKKTGKKRIKPKGGAKKRKTVRGGMFAFLRSATVNPFIPIDGENNWFSTLQHLETSYNNKEELEKDQKYQKYINEFKNNNLFREYIFKYIHSLEQQDFIRKLDFIEVRGLLNKSQVEEQIQKYTTKHPEHPK